jgi:predicted nucleotidyltransferase
MHPDRWWYLSDLAKHLEVSPSSLQREIALLSTAGILLRRRDGNRVYFQADTACPLLPELQGLLLKTVGLVDVLREELEPATGRITWAFVYGSVARGEELNSSDVDLMIIGDVGLAAVAMPLQRAEGRLLRPVNTTVYTRTEVVGKLVAGHPFLREVLRGDKLFVMGRDDDLESALAIPPRSAPHDELSGP